MAVKMILRSIIVLLLSLYFVSAIDDPQYLQTSDGGEISLKNANSIINIIFTYSLDGSETHTVNAELDDDNQWRARIDGFKPQKKIEYHATVNTETGTETTKVKEWTTASLMPLPPRRMRGAVIFREDFNGQSLNLNNWLVDVTATGDWHNEFQVYTNDHRNVYLKNGHLYLKPTLTIDSGHFTDYDLWHGHMDVKKTWGTCTNSGFNGCYRDSKNGLLPPICSGRVTSKPTLKYGTVTIRAQVPRGDWLWPAIWLMPKKAVYGGWPKSGEIDMMEAASNEFMEWGNGQKVGVQRVTGSFHMGPEFTADHHVTGAQFKKQGDWHGFHTYKLEWTPDRLILYVDDLQITRMDIPNGSNVWKHFNFQGNNPWTHSTKIAPFDQEFYLILNNAVGGNGIFGDSTKYAYTKPWKNNDNNSLATFWNGRSHWLPTWHGDDVAMLIDYVEFRHL